MADAPLLDGLHKAAVPGFFFVPGDHRILGWIREAKREGDLIIKNDPVTKKIDPILSYIMGEQLPVDQPSWLPKIMINKVRKAIRMHVSALTDIRPLFAYKTANPQFEEVSQLLNRIVIMWWVNTFADMRIGDAVAYSAACGAGDIVCEWDPHYNMEGDTRLLARDPRDTIPIRPTREPSLQTWEGLIIQEAVSPGKLYSMFPETGHDIFNETRGAWGEIFTRFKRALGMTIGGASSTLDGLKHNQKRMQSVIPEIPVYRVYLNDRSRNTTGQPIYMGKPATNWGYTVEPNQPLYPRKRLIVCTETQVLYDGPNQYWHGLYPVARLRLESWPWSFMGLPIASDMLPLQDAINRFVNDVFTNFSQSINRGMVADKNAVPETTLRRLDPREPRWKLRLNPTMGEGVKLADVAPLPNWAMNFGEKLFQVFDEMTGTANLQSLMQLRQMPSGDTIEKYYEALTPELKLEGRSLEFCIRELAEMVKCNIFQFYSMKRRMMMLGSSGQALSDFDFDPENLVPAMEKTVKVQVAVPDPMTGQPVPTGEIQEQPNPEYIPELDKDLPRSVRAQYFHRLFPFYVAPNSILALHAQEEQLKYIQLFQRGVIDPWTLAEMLEIPNYGQPPAVPLPARNYDPSQAPVDPMTGLPAPPPMEVRVPVTVTERLMAMQQMGMGAEPQPGRKPSAQEPAKLKERPDGSSTITESK